MLMLKGWQFQELLLISVWNKSKIVSDEKILEYIWMINYFLLGYSNMNLENFVNDYIQGFNILNDHLNILISKFQNIWTRMYSL